MDCDENSDSSSSSYNEDLLDQEPTQCLFCEIVLPSIIKAIWHLRSYHDFNLYQIISTLKMDQYSYIKMINYIRTHEINCEDLKFTSKSIWDDEKYLKPVKYEPWLTYDIEDINDDQSKESNMSLDEDNKSEKSLQKQIQEKDELIKQLLETVKTLQAGFRRIVDEDIDEIEIRKKGVASVPVATDEGYFCSYAHFAIHYDMLSDYVRTSSYRDAILNNKDIIKGKTVLDVGCGTSILSMFASSAGADKIVAIDNSEIIYKAMDISRLNNITNIDFVKGRLEDTPLPIDKFDVIVSEWMGYFLIFEGMLDSIIYARDRHLKVGGILMPNRCNITLVGYGDEKRHKEYVGFWDSVHGFNMSSMKKEVLQEPVIELCNPEHILTEHNVIADYDLNTVGMNHSNFTFEFAMKVVKSGNLTSFVGYFDTFFDNLPNKVSFSTSPADTRTHWKQVVFFIENPITVNAGDIINGKIQCWRNVKDMRSLHINIKLDGGKEYKYVME